MTTQNLFEELLDMRRRVSAVEAALIGSIRYGRVTREVDADLSLFEVETFSGGERKLLSPVHIYVAAAGGADVAVWASSPVLSTDFVNSGTTRDFGNNETWSVTAAGATAGVSAGSGNDNEELYLPLVPPDGVEGLRVDCEVGGSLISSAYVAWGSGDVISPPGFHESTAILQASLTQDRFISVTVSSQDETGSLQLLIGGWNTNLPADTRVLVYPDIDDRGGGSGASLVGSHVHVFSTLEGGRYHVGIRAND